MHIPNGIHVNEKPDTTDNHRHDRGQGIKRKSDIDVQRPHWNPAEQALGEYALFHGKSQQGQERLGTYHE